MKRFLAVFLSAVLLGVCLPFQSVKAYKKTFPDVKPGAWYYTDIMEMTEEGYLAGCDDGLFRPKREISAAEFVSIACRLTGTPAATGQISHWAAGQMQAALDRGWYDWDECPPDRKSFNSTLTRQVAVKILMKAFLPNARGDYNTESKKIKDFSQLDGRYYEQVFASYAEGIVVGDSDGSFHPKSGLSRAEACALLRRAFRKAGGKPAIDLPTPQPGQTVTKGGVSVNGKLQVIGTQLCNEKGEPVVLHGMSSHGLQWYGQYASSGAMKATASYGANLFRAAMYTSENGYLSQGSSIRDLAFRAVDDAIKNDMYVILDWHILSDGNPMDHLKEAKAFFTEAAKRYKDQPAVLYEICNEPNGNVSWAKDVKPYAQEMVKAIRDAGSDGVILIGSPTWSQDIHLAAADPVPGKNLMYTLHFYAGTHGKNLRDRIDAAMKAGLPVFVSEWGTSRADGSGGVFLTEAKEWLDFLDKRGVSWANWSLCDKNETSAALRPGAPPNGGWKQSDLSESGKFVFSRF